MITSKQILREIWSSSPIISGHQVDVFENPSSSDIKELFMSIKGTEKQVRFFADFNKQKVFVWDAFIALHKEVLKTTRCYTETKPTIMMGFGIVGGGKIVLDDGVITGASVGVTFFDSGEELEGLSDLIDLLYGYYDGSLSNSEVKKKYGEEISTQVNWLLEIFKYNWSFVDKYISGVKQSINKEKKRFEDWQKNYDNK